MFDYNITLRNDRITLRPMQPQDRESFKSLANDPSMWTWFPFDLSTDPGLDAWLNASLAEAKTKSRVPFTVIENETQAAAGSTSFMNISLRDQRIEIGATWMGKPFQGKGINDEMKYLMLNYCFEENDFERVEFKTDILNKYSRAAFTRMGVTEEGILRSHMLVTHGRRDTIYYSVLRSEWPGLKKANGWP